MRLEGRSSSDEVKPHQLTSAARRARGQLDRVLFEAACRECNRMAAIPQGAFAVLQVRKNYEGLHDKADYREEEREKRDNKSFNVLQEGRELTPLKYNSKLMNSIWGLYNKYSVHNFKKMNADPESAVLATEAWTGGLH